MSAYPMAFPLATGSLRVRQDEKGDPWFVAKDICDALGYRNDSDAISKHVDAEDKGVAIRDSLGGPQQMAEINESGMWSLILRSRKPEAKAFKRKVTSEILPAIRKTGAYGKPTAQPTPPALPARGPYDDGKRAVGDYGYLLICLGHPIELGAKSKARATALADAWHKTQIAATGRYELCEWQWSPSVRMMVAEIKRRGAHVPAVITPPQATGPDLSAMTEQIAQQTAAISALVPMLTALTTTLQSLSARVEALEAPRPAPARTPVPQPQRLRHVPPHLQDLADEVERRFTRSPAAGMRADVAQQHIRPGKWTYQQKASLTKAIRALGIPYGYVRGFQFYALQFGKDGIEHLPDTWSRQALPAPKLADGVVPLGKPRSWLCSRGDRYTLQARVKIKDGKPVEVYAGMICPDDAWLDATEKAFAAAFPGHHLRPGGYTKGKPNADWRGARGWDYDWSTNSFPPGHEAQPRDAGMVAKVCTGAAPTEAEWRSWLSRPIEDEDGRAVAVEWTGPAATASGKEGLSKMTAELTRLRYKTKPWKRIEGGWRAELVH